MKFCKPVQIWLITEQKCYSPHQTIHRQLTWRKITTLIYISLSIFLLSFGKWELRSLAKSDDMRRTHKHIITVLMIAPVLQPKTSKTLFGLVNFSVFIKNNKKRFWFGPVNWNFRFEEANQENVRYLIVKYMIKVMWHVKVTKIWSREGQLTCWIH